MNKVIFLEKTLTQLNDLLIGMGVPAEQGFLAAFVALYLGLTLVVLGLVLLLLRWRKRSMLKQQTDSSPEESGGGGSDTLDPKKSLHPSAETSVPDSLADIAEQMNEGPPVKEPSESAEPSVDVEPSEGIYKRLRQGLAKTRLSLVGRVDTLLKGHPQLDDAFVEELEEVLITADFGLQATQDLVEALAARAKSTVAADSAKILDYLKEEIRARLQHNHKEIMSLEGQPLVIMVVGVNGVGKTTTIGKLAKQYSDLGRKVLLGAGDTFRAAAAEQLQIWAERAGAEIVRHQEGSDPAAVAFDAARAAMARKADVLILDTAGRLHTKVNLMEELKKVRRVLGREIPGSPHETLLVLDATTGQNALTQAKMFQTAVDVSGIALTKLDGTAKGGILVAISSQLGLPIRLIGIGEGVTDLRPFDADDFVDALFANS